MVAGFHQLISIVVIRIKDIVQHIDNFVQPLDGSREILERGYLQKVGIAWEMDDKVHLCSACLRVTKADEVVTMKVQISRPYPGGVLWAECTCVGRSLGKCKHAVAHLQYVMT